MTDDDAGNWRRIIGLKYFSGSMLWVWVGPCGGRAQAPLRLPQQPWGFQNRDLAERAGRQFGLTLLCMAVEHDDWMANGTSFLIELDRTASTLIGCTCHHAIDFHEQEIDKYIQDEK